MSGQTKRIFFAIAAMLSQLVLPVASAEPTAVDQKIREIAQQKPDSGLVFMEVKLIERGQAAPIICQRISAFLGAKAKTPPVVTQNSPTLFGHPSDSSTYGGWAVLDEGVYTVAIIHCEGKGYFKGPFAKFVLRKGQVVNLGRLVIEYKRPELHLLPSREPNPGVWIVEDLSPEAVASLNKQAPAAFAKATKQYMSPVYVKPKQPAAASASPSQ